MDKEIKGKSVLITGGLGFIGSNLAIALVKLGAKVQIIDNLIPNLGGNLFNISSIKGHVEVNFADIRDEPEVKKLVKKKDYIFHLARQTDHILSSTNPYIDIDINVKGTTILLEACRANNPGAKFIYLGTRGQYGSVVKLPVSEKEATNPKGIYEVTNLAAEKIVQIYNDAHGVRSIMLRLTNVYGPRSQMKHNRYGVVNWFVRLAMEGGEIPVFGDGSLVRDFLFIDDAITAIIKSAVSKKAYGEVINVGRDKGETFLELTDKIIKIAGTGSYKFTPFSKERAAQEPGNFTSDITKIHKFTGWSPEINLDLGLKKTIEYYKKYRKYYW